MFLKRSFNSPIYCEKLICEFFEITLEEYRDIIRKKIYYDNGTFSYNINKYNELKKLFDSDIETIEKAITESDKEEQIVFLNYLCLYDVSNIDEAIFGGWNTSDLYDITNIDKVIRGRWATSDNKYLKFAGYICSIFSTYVWNNYKNYINMKVYNKGIYEDNPDYSEEKVEEFLGYIYSTITNAIYAKEDTILLNALLVYLEVLPDEIRYKYISHPYSDEKELTDTETGISQYLEDIENLILTKLINYENHEDPYQVTCEYIRKICKFKIFPYKIYESNIPRNPANIDLEKEYYVYYGAGLFSKVTLDDEYYIRRMKDFPNSYRVSMYAVKDLFINPKDLPVDENGNIEVAHMNYETGGIIKNYLDSWEEEEQYENQGYMFDYLDGSNDTIGIITNSALVISDTLEDAIAYYNYRRSIEGEV